MARAVLLVHSSGPQGRGEGSEPIARRMREELGPGHELLFPLLPEPENPRYGAWSERLGEILAAREDPVVLLGHSLGASVVVKHLSEGGRRDRVAGLVLAATPFWGSSDWEREWALPAGWPDPSTEIPPTYLFHSRDDDELPLSHLERYAERLPDAVVRPLDGTGHLFDRGDLRPVVEVVRALAEG